MMSQRFFFFLPLPFATCSLPTLAEFRSAVWYVWRLEIVPCVTGKPRPKTAPATQLDRCAKRIGSRVYEKSRDRKRGEMKFDFPFWASAFSAVLQLITVQFRSITGRSPLVPRRVLEECEHGSLRVGDHGHSANVLHGRRRQIKLASELLGLVRGPVAIGTQDVGQPVGWSVGAVKFGGRDASDKMLAVLDVQVVVLGIFLFQDHLPAEKITVKLACALRIGRAQISPAQGSIHVGDTDSLVVLRLPNGKRGSSRILQDSHAARIANVEGVHAYRSTSFRGVLDCAVGARDRDVEHPVRRDSLRALLRPHGVSRRRIAILESEDGIDLARTDWHVERSPSKQR